MPIYEYRCDQCQHVTELLRMMSQADDQAACQACGSRRTRRVQSIFTATATSGSARECPVTGAGCCQCVNDGACGLD